MSINASSSNSSQPPPPPPPSTPSSTTISTPSSLSSTISVYEKQFPMFQQKIEAFTLIGSSISGHFSCLVVPEYNIAFDMGCLFSAALACRIVCITHGHADHIASLAHHSRVRTMRGDAKATYLLPKQCIKQFKALFGALCSLDHDVEDGYDEQRVQEKLNAQLIIKGASAGFELELGKKRVLRCIETIHRVPSIAYVLCEKRSKLLKEFVGQSSDIIRAAVKSGRAVSETSVVSLLAYTGDTTIEGVLQSEELLTVPILIVECTIWEESDLSVAVTRERGHCHLDQFNEHAEKFRNQHVALTHVSPRYSKSQCERLLKESRFASVLEARGAKVYLLM